MLFLISCHVYMLQRWMLILSVAKISNYAQLRLIFFSFLQVVHTEAYNVTGV